MMGKKIFTLWAQKKLSMIECLQYIIIYNPTCRISPTYSIDKQPRFWPACLLHSLTRALTACINNTFKYGSRGRLRRKIRPLAHVRIQRVGQGVGPDNHIAIGFLSIAGPDPLKITRLHVPSQHSMFGHHGPASETSFKWRFAGEPMMACLKWYLDPLSPHQLKNIDVRDGPPLTKLSGGHM